MDIKQLSYFVRVAEMGSFTRASIVLDIAQPALSRQVRLLEVEIRQNLLIRNGRGITLTEAGKVLLEHSRGVLHQMERLREELSRVRGSLAGRVAVGLPPTLGRILAVPLTRAFNELMPDATLAIVDGLSKTMQESVLTGELDIAMVYNALPAPGIELRALVHDELLLVQGSRSVPEADAPIELADVARHPLIIPGRPNALRMHVETALLGIGAQPCIAMEVNSVSTILDLVAEGIGSAILPRQAVLTAAGPERFTLRRIVKPGLFPLLSLATSAVRPATGTQQATLDILERIARESLQRPHAST